MRQASMKHWCSFLVSIFLVASSPRTYASAGIVIHSPANGSTIASPATFAASATSGTCAKGISSAGVYVDNVLQFKASGSSFSTSLTLSAGLRHVTFKAWDLCGATQSSAILVTIQSVPQITVSMLANPAQINPGDSSNLAVVAANATQVTLTVSDASSYPLAAGGGSVAVTPAGTTTYTATATGPLGIAKATATVTVTAKPKAGVESIRHVLFMLQENHTFDNYFGQLNPYRAKMKWDVGADGVHYAVDGTDDKLPSIANVNDEGSAYSPFLLKSSCIDDMTAVWTSSYSSISRYDFSTNRKIASDGFVHTAEGFARQCLSSPGGTCAGGFTDVAGRRSMGYYDENFLNYYYFMASEFALSDRWFSPIASKTKPNRIATFTGGTTQGLVLDSGSDDHLPQLAINNIFQEFDQAGVPWKIYYTITQGSCLDPADCTGGASAQYPASVIGYLKYSWQYLHERGSGTCAAPAQPSSVVGDKSNSFCIDPRHIAPLSQYYTDVANNTLPSFAFIETGYGTNDEHPGSTKSMLTGQQQVAKVVNALMESPSWGSSVFFLSYDEGGGHYDHVPPVRGHSNDRTDPTVGDARVADFADIATIAVNPDTYAPCLPGGGSPTTHCDLAAGLPGALPGDAAATQGFAAQLGFRVPNLVISPFTRTHYVSHVPMDHTAVIKFAESRFIGPSAHLTARDAAQPDLLDFFDFTGSPWIAPPLPPVPATDASLGYATCTPQTFAP